MEIEEFLQAFDEIKKDSSKIPIWQVRIAQYPLAFIGECDKAIQWSYEMVGKWLFSGMFKEDIDKGKEGVDNTITNIVNEFGSHAFTKSHSRHISMQRCKELGLKIEAMEDDPNMQDAILSLHHITMRTLFDTPAGKIVENQHGRAYIQNIRI